jgi:hypothetical protein
LQIEQTFPGTQALSEAQAAVSLERLRREIIARAAAPPRSAARPDARRDVADSILRMLKRGDPALLSPGFGLSKFVQSVRLAETACFLDPDNAEAQAERIQLRWGQMQSSSSAAKNLFWSKWRASNAWGRYVDRFGLDNSKGISGPYGVRGAYVGSLADVVELLPRVIETPDVMPKPWSETSKAQTKGFPKDVPPERVAEWKAELEAELAHRRHKVLAWQKAHTNAPALEATLIGIVPSNAPVYAIYPTVGSNQVSPAAPAPAAPPVTRHATPGFQSACPTSTCISRFSQNQRHGVHDSPGATAKI